jgi:hypothetical protein
MKKTILFLTMTAIFAAANANAGAKIKINDDATIDLGFRLQALYINRDDDGNDEFKLRRARFRLKSTITDKASIFLQTEVSDKNMQMIDAFITLKPTKDFNIIVGEHMVPALRQNLTTSGALMALDRPGIAYKAMNWGSRSLKNFSNSTINETKAGFSTTHAVRDEGATIFGKAKLADNTNLKYYVGAYNGSNKASDESFQYAGRVQVNFGDNEAGYFNASTYLGKKQTYALGASIVTQADAVTDTTTGESVDYTLTTLDAFLEQPMGGGTVTAEAAYIDLDLEGAGELSTGGVGTKSEGNGYYLQGGYLRNNWQIWAGYETWDSTHTADLGSFNTAKVGVTYFIDGQHLNIKAGIESFNPEWEADSETTFVLGAYVTF